MPFSPRCCALLVTALAFTSAVAGCGTLWPDAPAPKEPTTARGTEVAPPPTPVVPIAAPGKHATRRDYYVVYHDFELDRKDPLFAELDALPEQVFAELKLPPGNTMVQVFLFDTQEHYERYMQKNYRALQPRRAYFISKPGAGRTEELLVFTWMGEHVATDLRHELTHALLHSVLKDVPIWLDEGLAGYFELPPGQEGVNPQHLDALTRSAFRPDLARLETLKQVGDMQKQEYREAWAWVHLMLRSGPGAKKVLLDYLQTLRTDAKPGPLLPKLREAVPDPEQALVDHLGTVEIPKVKMKPRGAAPK